MDQDKGEVLTLDADVKAKWIAALRSGKYRQARKTLRDASGAMCCLGVLCAIQGMSFDDFDADTLETISPPEEYCDLDWSIRHKLAVMNDGGVGGDERPHTFDEIASYIEANL